ncbi:hypothetical protein J2T09_001097 [Neorhizobium huautlense]|uniref:Secretin/TonB short N-terminal domain-containing protein n=1 Tax=Neorhizobium huautlense TaxID=67774 RepID=A0ABT9PPF6_9HYPH|nr:TonB-dependent receptor [Neorhizobium huautlense]MDP9836353.1 hypothetical protein [Neorhizobium huautlense]
MAVQAGLMRGAGAYGAKVGKPLALLLASAAIILPAADVSLAQTANPVAASSGERTFAIPAQPLASAIKAFIRATGWQVGYPSALLQNKSSAGISGRMSPEAALRAMLAGSGVGLRITGPETATLTDDAAAAAIIGEDSTVLGTITVDGTVKGVYLGTDSVSDTGTTTISAGQIVARSAGNDANDVLRNLPNVQYQNDIDDDAGVSDQDVIDLKPREVSIAGARVYENNFILEGMPINTVTGTEEAYGTAKELDELTASGSSPAPERIFGLHSQSVYVPTDFLESATIIDSNASAAYGNFQGGVVSYKMQDAATDRWKGNVSSDFTTSRWTGYHIGTEDGLNPNEVATPDYLKRRHAITLTGPITDNISIMGQFSRQTASTQKDKTYQYTEKRRVEEESRNDFYRAQIKADTDLGDFTLEGVYTDYSQVWENSQWRNMQVDQVARGLNAKLQHDYAFEDFTIGGLALSKVKLNSKLTYGSSSTANDMNGNVARNYTQAIYKNKAIFFESTELSDWCRTNPAITTTYCYDGATGDKEQGQDQLTWSQELTGEVLRGKFKLGGEYSYTDAYRRRPEEAIYYGSSTTNKTAGVSGFICNTSEECSLEQYASTKAVYSAFDTHAYLNQFAAYAELEQTWDWFNLRAGARVTYDDYMRNLDIAPRVVATVTPWEDFSISVGANRYYNAQSLAFALRDRQPRTLSYKRQHNGATVDDTWTAVGQTGLFSSSASGLDTPYTDELTIGLQGIEPLLGGQWRVRFTDRSSKDQFASVKTGVNYELTNDGSGGYQSVAGEYSKELKAPPVPGLDALLFNASATWSKRKVSNNSYYEDSFEDEYIYYKGQSYTRAGFSVVTGNMDIPVRLQAGLSSSWLDETLKVDVTANYNLGYTAALYTDENVTIDGKQHEIYDDFDFKSLLTFNLAASYEVYKKDDVGLSFNLRVDNVFDQVGNANASVTRPWLLGRTLWVGAKASF